LDSSVLVLPWENTTLSFGERYTCAMQQGEEVKAWCWGSGPVALALGTSEGRAKELPVSGIGTLEALPHSICFDNLLGERTCLGDPTHQHNVSESIALSHWNERCTQDGVVLRCPATLSRAAFALEYGGAITTSNELGCALGTNGEVLCWTNSAKPARVSALKQVDWLRETRVGEVCGGTAAGATACVTLDRVALHNELLQPMALPHLSGVKVIVAGEEHYCAIGENGSVSCWGSNVNGSLCRGSVLALREPETILQLKKEERLHLSSDLSCIQTGDALRCWGACRESMAKALGISCIPAPNCSAATSALVELTE
jgi:hypothetical protein